MAHHFSLPLVSTWSHGHSSYKGVWEMCSGLESRKKGEQDFGGQPTVSALVDNNAFNQNGKTRSQSSVRLSHIQDPSEFPRHPQRDSFLLWGLSPSSSPRDATAVNEEAWDHIQSFILQIKHELPIGLFLKSKKVIDKKVRPSLTVRKTTICLQKTVLGNILCGTQPQTTLVGKTLTYTSLEITLEKLMTIQARAFLDVFWFPLTHKLA